MEAKPIAGGIITTVAGAGHPSVLAPPGSSPLPLRT